MIIVDIAPKSYQDNYEIVFEGLQEVLSKAESRKEAKVMLMKYVDDLVLTNFLLKGVSFLDGKPKLKFNINAIQNNIKNMLMSLRQNTSFDGYTYFICGEKSNYVQNKDIPNITELFPNNNVITIPNAGHWIHFDQKQQFLDCIQQILSEEIIT